MPERLDRVTLALNRDDVILTWDARQALMRRLLYVHEPARLRDTFETVGATRPVELKPGQRATLLQVLEDWSNDGTGHGPMPRELYALRDALADHQWRVSEGLG